MIEYPPARVFRQLENTGRVSYRYTPTATESAFKSC